MKNLTKEAEALCKRLNKKKFNGIYIDRAFVENISDESVPDKLLKELRKHYTIFIIEPLIEKIHSPKKTKYTSYGNFDSETFWKDVELEIQKYLGNDVSIESVMSNNTEWEVIREKSYKEVLKDIKKFYENDIHSSRS